MKIQLLHGYLLRYHAIRVTVKFASFIPVSYTHLDVYKRQVQNRLSELIDTTTGIYLQAVSRDSVLFYQYINHGL